MALNLYLVDIEDVGVADRELTEVIVLATITITTIVCPHIWGLQGEMSARYCTTAPLISISRAPSGCND